MNRLARRYQAEAMSTLAREFAIKNRHQLPRLEKVVLNIGAGKAIGDKHWLEVATNTLRKISGQQPIQTRAARSIAGFKLRQGAPIGLKVTLRSARMYEFLDRLISIVLPRLRDFHGLSRNGFDKAGNYNLGIADQSVFPELAYEDTTLVHGLQITITTDAQNPDQAARLLELLGFPLQPAQSATPTEEAIRG